MAMYDGSSPQVIANPSLQSFFHQSVQGAINNQNLEASEASIQYLANLLTLFSRSEDLFEQTADGVDMKPLALMYADAAANTTAAGRVRILQKLGDTALFITGVFADSLNRKIVDVDYYIAMGGSAYSSVSSTIGSRFRDRAGQMLFDELTDKFVAFVDVLAEVCEQANFNNNRDVMRLYEVWIRTGSKRARSQLQKLGITPIPGSRPDFRH
ncbi:MAG: hypothetical protein LJE56_07235 [Acidiferrobacterales bacterium]|nr:hypothetical protein [Acidiferrobacterales bacterium]